VLPSRFNVRVPLSGSADVFLMNTLTDAQVIVSSDVAKLLDREGATTASLLTDAEREAVALLTENGFLVPDRESEDRELDAYFSRLKHDASEMSVTVLTTLQCNLACDYCFQGDHGDANRLIEKMTLDTAARVGHWIECELDRVHPERLTLMLFGGEPLLNLPVVYDLAEKVSQAARSRDIGISIALITNGLLLTPEVVDRLKPFGLRSVKVTLDGDREAHDRMRPLRGGQGTFDRIVENLRRIAGRCPISIGGNFEASSVSSYPALLDFLKQQQFAGSIDRVSFKPVIRTKPVTYVRAADFGPQASGPGPQGCLSSAGSGDGSVCDVCDELVDEMSFLRGETKRHGFVTPDGLHMGPCEVHRKHSYTIGTDGSMYACPGFTGEQALSIGHIDDRRDPERERARDQFERLGPWQQCGDCAFIPVCAGGCPLASHTQLGDMHTPTCRKTSFDSALIALAHEAASAASGDYNEDHRHQEGHEEREAEQLLPDGSRLVARRPEVVSLC
jgi:uncharacterized protein